MADMFRRELDRRVSLGGVHSKDCNPYHGKSKSLLRRLARRTTNRIEDYEKEDYNSLHREFPQQKKIQTPGNQS